MRLAALALLSACSGVAASVPCLTADGPPALTVDRCGVPERSLRFAAATSGGVEAGLDSVIERELLAQAALAAGVRAPTAGDIRRALEDGDALAMGAELPPAMFVDDETGTLDVKRVIRFAGSFGLPDADAFVAEQIREHLARAMRDRLGDDVGAWLAERCAKAKVRIAAPPPGYEACITAE